MSHSRNGSGNQTDPCDSQDSASQNIRGRHVDFRISDNSNDVNVSPNTDAGRDCAGDDSHVCFNGRIPGSVSDKDHDQCVMDNSQNERVRLLNGQTEHSVCNGQRNHEPHQNRKPESDFAEDQSRIAQSNARANQSQTEMDDVDMGMYKSTDISPLGVASRKLAENWQIVYNFTWKDVVLAFGSMLLFLVDIATDIKVCVEYFQVEQWWMYAGITAALITVPSFVTCIFSLHWYRMGYLKEKQERGSADRKGVLNAVIWFLRVFFTVLMMGPVVRACEYVYYGCKSKSENDAAKKKILHWKMLREEQDNNILRMFESFLESAPQLVLQLYITLVTKPEEDTIGITIRAFTLLSSWGSLAVSLVSYHKSQRNSCQNKKKLQNRSLPLYFLWRASETGGRVLCLAFFASTFQAWVFAFVLSHWLVNSVWLMCQNTTFYTTTFHKVLANVVSGYVMLFCYISVQEGHSRFRFLIYYVAFYVENVVMLALWFRFTPDKGEWFHEAGFAVVLALFVLHVIFQLAYYTWCHPTKDIKYCLPCTCCPQQNVQNHAQMHKRRKSPTHRQDVPVLNDLSEEGFDEVDGTVPD